MVDIETDENDRAFARRMNDEAEAWAYPLAPDKINADSTVAEIIAANKAAKAEYDSKHGV